MEKNKEKFEELIEKACNVYSEKKDKKLKKIIKKEEKKMRK